MISYQGSKSKMVKYYPFPKYDIVIEPFAGAAHYSLYYWRKNVVLNDTYFVITDIWNYLKKATPEQIKNLPNLKRGDDVRHLNIPQVEKNLLGFMVHRGASYPRNIYTGWAADSNEVNKVKERILKNLYKIKHFRIIHGDYRDLDNVEATWFVDPPYQYGKRPGSQYVHHNIDYDELADWCKSRKGQVIVCENAPAEWLDFKFLKDFYGQGRRTIELIWTNDNIHLTKPNWIVEKNNLYRQMRLFD